MAERRKGCLGRAALLLAVVLIAYGGWRWGSAVFPRAEEMLGIERPEEVVIEPTPQVSQDAFERLERFQESDEGELRLDALEVSSLLRYAIPGLLPEGVVDPVVYLEEDRIEVRAGVIPNQVPDLPDLGGIVGILPDTVPVMAGGTLIPFGESASVLMVTRMRAKSVPIPRRAFPEILEALGRTDEPGLPPEGIAIPVPGSVRGAYVEEGQLVLIRQ